MDLLIGSILSHGDQGSTDSLSQRIAQSEHESNGLTVDLVVR
jgi:hypothetical protein